MTITALLLSIIIGFAAVAPERSSRASAVTFNWSTQPYLRDAWGNYAYRGMSTNWWGCGSGWCWFGQVTSYVNIVASPEFGYHYDSAGILRSGTGGWFPNNWNGTSLYLNYYNTPYNWSPTLTPTNVDLEGTAYVHAAHCSFMVTYPDYGNILGATIPYNTTSPGWGNCGFKKLPHSYGC